jgi:hypothetical protein
MRSARHAIRKEKMRNAYKNLHRNLKERDQCKELGLNGSTEIYINYVECEGLG